ncbi:MAG: multicopper oxidase domain-containing protein [Acidobacteriota bacterium]|nr:multicopper oxidase domain-containing protein [Acidobacteriota bacterium]
MWNASDDIHPIRLHRHVLELTSIVGQKTAGVMKEIVVVGGYQTVKVVFVANNPGLTFFHCHQQLHMDFGFMTLFDYLRPQHAQAQFYGCRRSRSFGCWSNAASHYSRLRGRSAPRCLLLVRTAWLN